MKKISVLLLAFLMLLSFSACSSKSSTFNTQLKGDVAYPKGEGRLFSLWSYSEYLDFLKKTDLPDGFVTYDQIKEWGTFEGFIAYDDYIYFQDKDHLNILHYSLTDAAEKNIRMTIYINGSYKKYIENTSHDESMLKSPGTIDKMFYVMPIDSDDSDLRMCKTVDNGIDDSHVTIYTRQIGNLTYHYCANGELNYIEYDDGDTHVNLEVNGVFSDYPINEKQTEMSKLLNRSTAEKEIQRFTMKIQEQDR